MMSKKLFSENFIYKITTYPGLTYDLHLNERVRTRASYKQVQDHITPEAAHQHHMGLLRRKRECPRSQTLHMKYDNVL